MLQCLWAVSSERTVSSWSSSSEMISGFSLSLLSRLLGTMSSIVSSLAFFSPVNQVGVYLVRGCHYIGIKHNEVSDCHVIIITKVFKNSCELLIDFSVLASAVSFRSFEATPLTAVNYCVCRHICQSHLQPMNCFRNINILYYLRGLFPPSIRDTTYFKSNFW